MFFTTDAIDGDKASLNPASVGLSSGRERCADETKQQGSLTRHENVLL
jgi:hypothetical protein